MRAHLFGGVPRVELDAHAQVFAAHGIDVFALFASRDESYVDFTDSGASVTDAIEQQSAAREAMVATAFDDWWRRAAKQLSDTAGAGSLVGLRADLLDSFAESLAAIGLLDRHELRGLAARWWDHVSFDLETLATRGADGVVDGWLTTAAAAQEAGSSLIDQPVIAALAPEILAERERFAAEAAELDATIKASEATSDDEDDDTDDEREVDEVLTPAQLKTLKAERSRAKKALKALDANLLEGAAAAREQVASEQLAIDLLRAPLQTALMRRVASHRRHLIARYETWHDKYNVTLGELELERDGAAKKLADFLSDLGYV